MHKKKKADGDVVTSLFADGSQSRTSANTMHELERRNSCGLTIICREQNALWLKVNKDKTKYMVLASISKIGVCGEKVKSSVSGKRLELLVSNGLSWKHKVDKVV